jgi:hypothetical protein
MPITATAGALTYNKTPITTAQFPDYTYFFLETDKKLSDVIIDSSSNLYVVHLDNISSSTNAYTEIYEFDAATGTNKAPLLTTSFVRVNTGMGSGPTFTNPQSYTSELVLDNTSKLFAYGYCTQFQTAFLPNYTWPGAIELEYNSSNSTGYRAYSSNPPPISETFYKKIAYDSTNQKWFIGLLPQTRGYNEPIANGSPHDNSNYIQSPYGKARLGYDSNATYPKATFAYPGGLAINSNDDGCTICAYEYNFSNANQELKCVLTLWDKTVTAPFVSLDFQWQREIDVPAGSVSPYTQYPTGLVIDSNDNIYCLLGNSTLIKYNVSGTLQWARTINWALMNDNYFEEKSILKIDSNDDLYVAVYAPGAGGVSAGCVMKIDTSGTKIFSRFLDVTVSSNGGPEGLDVSQSNKMCLIIDKDIVVLPNDGTLTGTYGNLVYSTDTSTLSTKTQTDVAGTDRLAITNDNTIGIGGSAGTPPSISTSVTIID